MGDIVKARLRDVVAAGIHRLAAGGDPMYVALLPVAADLEQAACEIEALPASFWLGRKGQAGLASSDEPWLGWKRRLWGETRWGLPVGGWTVSTQTPMAEQTGPNPVSGLPPRSRRLR
jgi:hypothetical protein